MLRFFFHVIGSTIERDEVGTELPSPAHARCEGCRLIGVLLAEGLLDRNGQAVALEVTDEADAVLFRIEIGIREVQAARMT